MSATKQWAEGLPQPHTTILITLAASWEHTHAVFSLLQGKVAVQTSLTKPNLEGWLKLYDSDSLLTDELFNYFRKVIGDLVDISQIETLNTLSGPDVEQTVADFFTELSNLDTNQLPDAGEYAFALPMAFLILVWMPCLALYGDYPPVIMKKARDGDLNTICNLIKLDRSAIFDPQISQIIHTWTMEGHGLKLKRIGDTFSKGIPSISKKKIKLAWAQYVYDTANSFGMPLTAPKVRALFDALSQDAGTGFHDPDLVEMTDDAFYQAIAKYKKPLSNLLKYRNS